MNEGQGKRTSAREGVMSETVSVTMIQNNEQVGSTSDVCENFQTATYISNL